MTIATNDIVQATATIALPSGVRANNVFTMRYNGIIDVSNAVAAGEFVDWMVDMYSELDTIVIAASGVLSVRVLTLNTDGSVKELIADEAVNEFGAGGSEMLPHGAAAVVRAATTDPRAFARRYIAGINEAQQTSSAWAAGTLTALAAFGVAWMGGPYANAIGGLYDQGVLNVLTGLFRSCLGTVVVSGTVGYQRRRKPGVGT